MTSTWTFHSAGEIVFGCGAVSQLASLVSKHGAGKVMVVTDSTLE